MIRRFRHKGLKRLYDQGSGRGLPADRVPKIGRILARLDVAAGPEAMDLPGYRLHPLKGAMKGYWPVWVSGNWRIVFRFEQSGVFDVDFTDYH